MRNPNGPNGGRLTEEQWKKNINNSIMDTEEDFKIFEEVVIKIFEDNNNQNPPAEGKHATMNKESAEKWVKSVLGSLLQGEDDKKDPFKDSFNELWDQWSTKPTQ